MASQLLPVTSQPNQSFTASLKVDGSNLVLRFNLRYNEMAGYWVKTIADKSGNALIDSLPLVTGSYPAANLLKQYGHLNIGSAYIVNVSGTSLDYPNGESLGTDHLIVWGDTAA